MKIIITDFDTMTNGDITPDIFSKYGELKVYGLTPPDKIKERIKDCEVLLCNKTPLTGENLSAAKNLKYIGLFATGYNNVDLEYTSKNNITVCNAGEYSTNPVVQHTFGLIFEIFSRIGEYNNLVKNHGWQNSSTFSWFPLKTGELYGKTMGIIGYGSIGRRVKIVAESLGMKTLVMTRTIRDDSIKYVDFNEILKESDIISIHCPLNDQSYHMFDDDAFSKCKKDAVLINTARGAVVDEKALYTALKKNKIYGAGLDVLEREPMSPDCPLINCENCIITPHTAWAAVETRERLMEIVSENLRLYLLGTPQNIIEI